jgi:hypothetical protein
MNFMMRIRMARTVQINESCIAHQQERLRLVNEELAVHKALVVVAQQRLVQSVSLGVACKDILKASQQRLIQYVTDEAARHEEQESD